MDDNRGNKELSTDDDINAMERENESSSSSSSSPCEGNFCFSYSKDGGVSRSHQTGKFHPSIVWNTPPLSLSPLWKSWKLLYPRPSPSPSPSPASKRSALLRDLEEQYNKRDEARGREEGGCRGGLEGTGVLLISKVPKLIIRSPRSRPAKGEGTQFLGRHGFTFNFL